MTEILEPILRRRAVKVFEPVQIPESIRTQILEAARSAPSSFNSQPYRFFWIESPELKRRAAHLCMGQQPATTASALVVAVADIASWNETAQAELAWMRTAGFSEQKIAEFEKRAKLGKWFFLQGLFGEIGVLKSLILRVVHLRKIIGTSPVARHGMFKWAGKSAALACANLMIAAEALGWNTCPMEGFDNIRLAKFLGLSRRRHEILMVIAIGKKSADHLDRPQWRRPLESTVTVL
ncbi:MAG TPA: nitroreductase family protein [Candidatus Acidoferrales bacterium]